MLSDSDNKKWAEVYVDKVGGSGTFPAGWMGAGVTLYRNGVACTNAVMTYTAVAMNNYARGTASVTCGAGTYNARGSTAAYNGNGYNYYYTNYSPSQYEPS